MKKEFWKPILNYERHYQVSNFGRVKSIKFGKERILKTFKNKDGYFFVVLYKNGKKKIHLVHRLVVDAFLEIPEELKHLKGTRYLQVNHKDENKQNNVVSNLEWCSSSYNINFGTRNKRVAAKNTNGKCSKTVLQYDLEGNLIREWKSVTECGRNGYNQGHVAECCNGKRKTHKGFIWRY